MSVLITKTCMKCGAELPLEDFYRHSEMADMHLNKCKVCTKADVRLNRRANIEYYREYDNIRGKRNQKKTSQEYRKENPLKYQAHTLLNNSIQRGKVIKGVCEICGDSAVVGHHEDYLKPLDVIWLCAKHHSWIHG